MSCKFEEVRLAHLSALLSIYNYYVSYSTSTFHEKELTVDEMKSIVFFNDSRHKAFTIFLENQIVGYVVLAKHKLREAYSDTGEVAIYINKEYRHRGIGKEAIRYIEDYARKQNFHVLIATICGDNVDSIKLFQSSGFEKCAHFKEVGKKFGKLLDVVSFQKILN